MSTSTFRDGCSNETSRNRVCIDLVDPHGTGSDIGLIRSTNIKFVHAKFSGLACLCLPKSVRCKEPV